MTYSSFLTGCSVACFVAACGGRTVTEAASAQDGATFDVTGSADATAIGLGDSSGEPVEASGGLTDATDAAAEDSSPTRQFRGVVLARWTPGSATPYQAYADFSTGAPIGVTCPNSPQTVGGCCCQSSTALPGTSPSAGILQLSRLTGQGLLALIPPSSALHGTSDLGPTWYLYPGVYEYVDSGVWFPGDAIAVAGGGADLFGFEGTLHTGAALTGVTPAIGPDAMVVQRSQGFGVSWTPEGMAGEKVLLVMRQVTTQGVVACFCSADDSAGELAVDTSVLASFTVDQQSSTITLERVLTSTVVSDDAIIDLVGEVAQAAVLSFQ